MDNKKRSVSADEDVSKLKEEKEESYQELDCVMYERNNFSESTIQSLSDTLDEEEHLHPKKVLYLEAARKGWPKSLVNTTYMKLKDDDDKGFFLSRGGHRAVKRPPTQINLPDRGYGMALWNTKIIIAGGEIFGDMSHTPCRSVFQYDTVAREWFELPSLKFVRPNYPTLVAVENKLFLFGGGYCRHDNPQRDIFLWGEYCPDLNALSWEWKPFRRPPRMEMLEYESLPYYAVYPKGNKILFGVHHLHIISFDYIEWKWHIYDVVEPIRDAPMWSCTVVLLDHLLFWHDHGTIYARDLSTPDQTTIPLYTFPDPLTLFGWDGFCPTFLHRTRNSELSLFWLAVESGFICYQSFEIEISAGDGLSRVYLVPGRHNKIETKVAFIYQALEFKVPPKQMDSDEELVDSDSDEELVDSQDCNQLSPWKEIQAAQDRVNRGTFNEQVLDALATRLLAPEVVNTNKLVYLCVGNSLSWLWLVVDANQSSPNQEIANNVSWRPLHENPTDCLTGYGCAVWKSSNIIVAGGTYRSDNSSSNEVFMYDTTKDKWDSLPPMQARRGLNPTLVVAESQLFVVGGFSQPGVDDRSPNIRRFPNLLSGLWAEVCNLDATPPSWESLPVPQCFIDKGLRTFNVASHVVCPKQENILFRTPHDGIFSYSYREKTWTEVPPLTCLLSKSLPWSSSMVVFEDFLFWHHCGVIYAHDLASDTTLPMYSLPPTDLFDQFSGPFSLLPSFLCHVGNGRLCLFCFDYNTPIWYCTFLIHLRQCHKPTMLHIIPGQSGFLKDVPPFDCIEHALEISS